MKMLICGAGSLTQELLKRLGELWEVSLVDGDQARLDLAAATFPNTLATVLGDPSSPVVLERAGLARQDYVLALDQDDEVNLAVGVAARQAGVKQVLAVFYQAENHPRFEKHSIQSLLASAALARDIHRFLEDPEMRVTPLNLGRGAVMEVEAARYHHLVGRRTALVRGEGWRLAALFRRDQLLLPDQRTRVLADDRLVLVGRQDMFSQVCQELECQIQGFPRAHGQAMLLLLWPDAKVDHAALVHEGLYWVQNTVIERTMVLCRRGACRGERELAQWPATAPARLEKVEGSISERARQLSGQESIGLVMTNKFEPSFLGSLGKAPLLNLAESLGCPLLLAGGGTPCQSILVPFNAQPRAEAALEVAVDLARQVGAGITLASVEEPDFINGAQQSSWLEGVRTRARELAHLYKLDWELKEMAGNPVREIAAISDQYDLMVVGGSSQGGGLFRPNLAEHLAQKAACSVLVLAV